MRKRTGYLVRRGKVFYAAWTVGGKKFMQTTGKRDRREAEKELRRIMEPFIAGDEVVTLQNIAARIEGRTAELTRLEDDRNPPVTIETAWTTYLTAPTRPDSGERTASQYEGHYAAFAKWIRRTHPDALALRDVTTAVAGEYAQYLNARGLSANRYNKHVRFLTLLFRVLKEPARLAANPWEGIQRKRVVTQSRRELTVDELKTVCATAAGEMRLLFALGIYTGLRLGDCATLRWAEVDLRRRIIRRIPGKTARSNPRPVIIPIHPVLSAMLSESPSTDRGEYVVADTAALYLQDATTLSNRVQAHFTACGVRTIKRGTGFSVQKDKDGKEKRIHTGKRAVVEVGFHSLRHTFVSLCREANAPLAVVESIVGHSNPAMTRHYTHVSELAASQAVAALPAVINETNIEVASTIYNAPKARILEILKRTTARTWLKDAGQLRELISVL